MQLDLMTWHQVDEEIAQGACLVLPTGSTEQHGPMGFIGTDRICAEAVAARAAAQAGALMAPPLAYTPAPFNTAFPGTLSVSEALFESLVGELFAGALAQGFAGVYVLNGHGANIAPMQRAAAPHGARIRIRSWWDFAPVTALRDSFYGDWEGMHATPSEIAITQVVHHPLPAGDAAEPPRPLSPAYIRAHAGDRHGPPDAHRAEFPDGRVGSHSALATSSQGEALLTAAATAVAKDLRAFRDRLCSGNGQVHSD